MWANDRCCFGRLRLRSDGLLRVGGCVMLVGSLVQG